MTEITPNNQNSLADLDATTAKLSEQIVREILRQAHENFDIAQQSFD